MRDRLNALSVIDQMLESITTEKRAGAGKQADFDPSNPTTHPVMKAPDGTVKATEGSRAAENDSDIKKDLGEAGNTGQDDANSATSAKPTDSIGTVKQDSAEVKGNVQDPKSTLPKPTKNDGGGESPSHPSNETFSEKYSRLTASTKTLLEKIAAGTDNTKKKGPNSAPAIGKSNTVPVQAPESKLPAGPANAEKDAAEAAIKAAAAKYPEEAEAGYLAARLLAENVMGIGKTAAEHEELANERADAVIKYAHQVASDYVDYVRSFEKGAAMGNAVKAANTKGKGAPTAKKANDAGAMIPAEALEAGAPGVDAGAMGGGAPMGGAGGGDPMGGAGGDPLAGAGAGPEMGGGAGGGGGGMSHEDEILEAVISALEQAGVTPQDIEAAMANGGGGDAGAGGAPMDGMGASPAGGDIPVNADTGPAPAGGEAHGGGDTGPTKGESTAEDTSTGDAEKKEEKQDDVKAEKSEGAKEAALKKIAAALLKGTAKRK